MGGDHKCPVCQATFTRPQHVARHMRSHTGDRPYKCQHCGDQFARSDLLARHINKCHANEKSLPNVTAGGRRKGSAAASRAATSKQACDQCVQSSLPCDGSNPCSKCISRKCRCTYVKFHRQTAPSGPGHHAPRSSSFSSSPLGSSMGSARFPSHLDDFILAPPPPVPPGDNPPFSDSDQILNTPFTFNPTAPAYVPNWTGGDMSHLPFSMASDADMTAKHRAQAEFLRRTSPSIPPNSLPTMLPIMYATQQNQQSSSHWYPVWGESGTYPHLDDTKSFDGIARTHSLTSSEPPSFAPEFYGAGLIGSAYRPRRTSLDFSDSSSTTSHSVPSSANSSSLHLPLSANEAYDGSEEMRRQYHDTHVVQHHRRSSMPTTQAPPFPPTPSDPSQPALTQQPHRVGEGSFSSAFGLMSIDDPNVLAGLSSEVPFFSNLGIGVLPHSPNATPMPTHVQQPHSQQGRERPMSLSALPTHVLPKETADTRELKDMWKTYLRSPLSGSGTAAPDVSSFQQLPQSPSGQRRRVRVSSLPTVTPTLEKGHPLMANGHGEVGRAAGGSSVRTTAHGNPEDLRSYEAAVNARSAPLKLNLVPRRKGTRPSLRASPPMEKTGVVSCPSSSSSAVVGPGAGQGDYQSRPSSSSSTSSLAQAFTVPSYHNPNAEASHTHGPLSYAHAPGSGVVKPPPMQGASISLPIPPSMSMSGLHSVPHSHSHSHSIGYGSSTSLTFEPGSRASSVTSDETGTGGSGSDGEVFRPSFKRYASQTLGPVSSKRALVESGESQSVKVDKGIKREVRDAGGSRIPDRNGMEGFEGVGVSTGSPGSRPIAALPERAKRG